MYLFPYKPKGEILDYEIVLCGHFNSKNALLESSKYKSILSKLDEKDLAQTIISFMNMVVVCPKRYLDLDIIGYEFVMARLTKRHLKVCPYCKCNNPMKEIVLGK